jgi:hypothetical protein
MYTSNRLEWHQDVEAKQIEPRRFLCGLARQQAELLISLIRFAVALAKSQDHRASCGVFAFGQRNTVRQWLRLRYPDTRQAKSGNVGLVLERGGCRQSETVRCDGMAPKSRSSKYRRTLVLTTVRLCFAPTFTKEQ